MQEELVFIKSMSNFELSPVFLRELRNAVAAGKKEMPLAASKENASSASALQHQSVLRSEAPTTLESLQLELGKRELNSFPGQTACLSAQAVILRSGIFSVTCPQPKDPRVNL